MRDFLAGAGTVLELFPIGKVPDEDFAKYVPTNDAESLAKDWKNVGRDMWSALGRLTSEKESDQTPGQSR